MNCRTHEHRRFERKWRHAPASHTWLRAVKAKGNLQFVESLHKGNGPLRGAQSTMYTRLLFVSALGFLRTSVRGALKSVDRVRRTTSPLFRAGPYFASSVLRIELKVRGAYEGAPRTILASSGKDRDKGMRVRRAGLDHAESLPYNPYENQISLRT